MSPLCGRLEDGRPKKSVFLCVLFHGMRYSVNPVGERWQFVGWTMIAITGVWIGWGLIPIGIDFRREVKNHAELAEGDLQRLLGAAESKGWISTEAECRRDAWRCYKRTFLAPWDRSFRGEEISIISDDPDLKLSVRGPWGWIEARATKADGQPAWILETSASDPTSDRISLIKY